MEQITLTIHTPVEKRTFSIYKADSIIIPEGCPVVEFNSIIDFLTQCDEHLYQKEKAVYYMPGKNGDVVYCCSEFWEKHKELVKARDIELKKLQAEQQTGQEEEQE